MVTSRRIPVFFYGLFMDIDLLRARGIEAANLRPASIAGVSLRIGRRAAVVPDPAGRVYGMLGELTHDEIDSLYSEPSVRMYKAEPTLVDLGDRLHTVALCFNLPTPPEPTEANPEYAGRLRDLARRLGMPRPYIDSI
jgi:hypothetical protein